MIQGKVVDGKKIGRVLGFPTANILIDNSADTKEGVFAARIELDGKVMHGMAYVGYDKTGRKLLEVNIFDYHSDIYGREVGVELEKYMRPIVKFDTTDALKAQLALDRQNIIEYFKNKK